MLTYNFENRDGVSLYDYLYRCIKSDILDGRLMSNEKLPSKRSLAQHLNLSVITVMNAYTQLITEGYIYAVEKRGYFVRSIEKQTVSAKMPQQIEKVPEKHEYFMDFKTNSIKADYFPFSVWSKLMREVLLEQDTRLLHPAPYNGVALLREAIADHLYHFRGMSVNAEQIVVGAGTEYLYNLIIQLLGRDNILAIENPGYHKISKIYDVNNVHYEYVNIDEHGMSVKELENSQANIIHISPSHHYPTGIVTSIGRRHQLLQWANESENRYIIEDDYDSEFRFAGRPIQPLQSIDMNEKVIFINTFSKSMAPSIRISYMVLPPHLLKKYRSNLGFYSCTVPSFEQYTLAKFITGGYFERHINKTKKLYRAQRDKIISEINNSSFHDRVTVLGENAGLHFLLKIKTDKSDAEIITLAAEKNIGLSCLSEYLNKPDKRHEHFVVVNYSGIDCGRLEETIMRLETLL